LPSPARDSQFRRGCKAYRPYRSFPAPTELSPSAANPPRFILPGALLLSDPVKLNVPVLGDLAISLYFADTTMTSTLHYAAQQNSYVAAGDATATEHSPIPTPVTSWSFLTAVDVLAPESTGLIVAFGDSLPTARRPP